ncbi:MAG TPA: FHA domain-containing protein [Thermomicrobiales bacterium]
MVACTICGKENPAGVEYCEDCGAALNATAGAPPADSGTPEPSMSEVEPPAPSDAPFSAEAELIVPPLTSPDADESTPPPVMPTITNPRLAVKRYGVVTAEEIPLLGDRLVVGRFDPESGPVDIDLSGAPEAGQLSRHHAELYREADGQWHVKDLGSTNGVFVKRPESSTFGPRLTTPTALHPGDEVAFGNARFVFVAD